MANIEAANISHSLGPKTPNSTKIATFQSSSMAAADGGDSNSKNPTGGLKERAENQWLRIKEHAETYPYVWGSYILVYGGLGAYITYRWTKLRRTESRVRILQERLRKLVEAEESASGSGSNGPGSTGS